MLRELLSKDAGHVCLLLSMENLIQLKQHFVKTAQHSRNSKSIFCSTRLKSLRPSPLRTVAFVQQNKWDLPSFSKGVSYKILKCLLLLYNCALLFAIPFLGVIYLNKPEAVPSQPCVLPRGRCPWVWQNVPRAVLPCPWQCLHPSTLRPKTLHLSPTASPRAGTEPSGQNALQAPLQHTQGKNKPGKWKED